MHQTYIHPPDTSVNDQIFLLENLGCAHCAAKMEEKINALPGVKAATITFATRQLRISAADPSALLPAIQKICSSIEADVKVNPGQHAGENTNETAEEGSRVKKNTHRELFYILCGAFLFLTGVFLQGPLERGPAALLFFLAAYILLGGKVLLRALKNISHGQIFDENFLMSIATLGAFAIREYPEAVGVMLFYRIGEFFEDKAVDKSRSQIMSAVDMRPEVVNLQTENGITVVPAETVSVGDILLIRPGDRIPLDGVITAGESRLDTSPITGEPVPIAVKPQDEILSGSVNISGQLKMRAEKPLSESMVTKILNSVENAAANKPKIDRFITKFAKIYTPCVVFAALAIAILPSLVSGRWDYWVYTALTFLVMSCPCALVLSVPLAFFSGIGAGSRRSILFKGGIAIETLAHLKAVVMDKTGTVTEGNFKLQKIIPAASCTEEELLSLCAACEQNSTHPIAVSITAAAKERNITPILPDSLTELAGYGIVAKIKEKTVLCGNQKLMEMHKIPLDFPATDIFGTKIYLAVDKKPAGYLIISDTIKPDAHHAVSRLKALGLHTVMLTGDSAESAAAVAEKTGIEDVHAKLLPQDKVELLTKIRQTYGPVMFVGDGINDAPVLAGADVGAAMGSGADAAIEAADAVFMTTAVDSIVQSVTIARRTNRIAIQNVAIALTIKIAVMILGLSGHANMWMAVFADTGVAAICILNAVRALYKR